MEESKQRKIGVILSYASIIISTLIQLLYTPFLIRMLGQSEYGLYSLINSVIGYLTVLDLGFGNAIIVYTVKYRAQKKYEDEKKLHGMFFAVFCIIALVACILGFILYLNIDNLFAATMSELELKKAKIMMLIMIFNLTITFIFSIFSSIISAYEKFIYQKVISLLGIILKPLIMCPLLFMGYKSITMVIVLTIVNIIILLSNYFYCRCKLNVRVKYYGFDRALFKTIFGYSIWIFIGTIVDKINWSVDHFVLGAVSGTIAVSIYSVASHLNNLFINLSTAVSGILLPKISKLVANNVTGEELSKEFIKVGRLQYYIIFLMASGLVLIGKEFFNVWVGPDYWDSYYIALLLILPLCIPLIQNLGVSIMQAKNMHKFRSLLCLAIAIANIFVSIPLAKAYGGIGAAIGTAISLLIGNGLIINIYYHKKVGLNIPKFWIEILKMTLYFTIPVGLILVFIHFVKLNGIISLLVYAGLYTILYLIISYLLVMNDYEKNIINKLLLKLKLKKA